MAGSSSLPWDDGNEAPLAYAWVDEDDESTLKFRAGHVLSCWGPYVEPREPFLVSPGGWPPDTLAITTYCDHPSPVAGVPVTLTFTDVHIWDPTQENPTPAQVTDEDGQAAFQVRAGGCVPWANVKVDVGGLYFKNYTGVASPDVDGDCIVTNIDKNLVRFSLGTSEYCADLDGSGLVTDEDVAIVQAALGDRCTAITGAEDASVVAETVVRAIPNPSSGVIALRMELPQAATVDVRVVDANGRLVRSLGTSPMDAGSNIVTWDGLDPAGQPVASGVYFALVRAGEETHRRTLLIVR